MSIVVLPGRKLFFLREEGSELQVLPSAEPPPLPVEGRLLRLAFAQASASGIEAAGSGGADRYGLSARNAGKNSVLGKSNAFVGQEQRY